MLNAAPTQGAVLPVRSIVPYRSSRRIRSRSTYTLVSLGLGAVLLTGCSHLKPAVLKKYVYVTAKSTFLRDRIAAVSNRTGTVTNGERLEVIDQNRRFYKVKTDKGEIGWIDERAVATPQVADEFAALHKDHEHDSVVATGTVRDDVYLHNAPGRETDRFYRLEEGDKLKLLARSSTLKPLPPGTVTPGPEVKKVSAGNSKGKAEDVKAEQAAAEPPPMEDWWLVTDQHGYTGWMLSRMLDTDAPDAVAKYAENQRIVGTYVLNTVTDPDLEGASKQVPEYVMLLSPYKAGLPYDFNQLRVFYWNIRKHRYEGANRDRNIMGYLPVKIGTDPGRPSPGRGIPPEGPAPSYTYYVLPAGVPIPQPDPKTGILHPTNLIAKTYRLEGNNTRRVLPPGATPPAEAHADPEEDKRAEEKKAARAHRHRR